METGGEEEIVVGVELTLQRYYLTARVVGHSITITSFSHCHVIHCHISHISLRCLTLFQIPFLIPQFLQILLGLSHLCPL